METYYKATAPDGRSFHSPHVDYGAALLSGEPVTHPSKRMVKNDASTYLSVSVSAADCTGASWPCRLFRVEPEGKMLSGMDYPNKRACLSLRVVEELPSWQTFGPNGQEVAWVIERIKTCTPDEIKRLGAARAAAWDAAWAAARAAAWAAARAAAWAAAWDATRDAAWAAAWAYLTRDLITEAQFQTLAGPWLSVIGPVSR